LNGFARPDLSVELVTLRVAALSEPSLTWSELTSPAIDGPARLGERIGADGTAIARWRRAGLAPGAEVTGPAVIEEVEATTWLGRDEVGRVLDDGTLLVTW
jgi:N-methylhydantoinase A/oxoprolinase/acetone carboxylase beta subunit